jgi:hypothetical protein
VYHPDDTIGLELEKQLYKRLVVEVASPAAAGALLTTAGVPAGIA